MIRIVKFLVFSLVLLSLPVLNSVWSQVQGQTRKVSFQNFEPHNGTKDEYFFEVWNCEPVFGTKIVHSGFRSLRAEISEEGGGTVGVNVASKKGYIDLSKAKKISIWVYNTGGNDTVEIRLRDIEGNGGSGNDGNTLWSKKRSRKNKWTRIVWNLNAYPEVEDLDLARISTIEIYTPRKGVCYFDDLEFK